MPLGSLRHDSLSDESLSMLRLRVETRSNVAAVVSGWLRSRLGGGGAGPFRSNFKARPFYKL